MIIFDDARTISQRLAQDTSADAQTVLDLFTNIGYKQLLNILDRATTEKVKTGLTEADERQVQVSPDTAHVKNVTVTVGTTKHHLDEIKSERAWDGFTQQDTTGIPARFFFRPRFGFGGGLIELDPIPGDEYTIKLTVEATDKDLSQAKYTAGTVTLTNASAVVTGIGTTFVTDMANRYFRVTAVTGDRLWYRLGSYSTTTRVNLENVYQGADVTSVAYEIAEAFNLPEDLHMLPIFYAEWLWWSSKRDKAQAREWERMWKDDFESAQVNHAGRTRDNIIRYDDYASPFEQAMPGFFPSEVT